MAQTATCNVCVTNKEENPFSVPWDMFGKALLEEHFKDKHPEIDLSKLKG